MIYYEEFLASIYDSSPYFGQGRTRELDKFNGFYYRHLRDLKTRVLEFGSGTGLLSIPLAAAGHVVDAVDISPYMHDVLAAKLASVDPTVARNVNQILGDATTYVGPAPYDAIVMPEGILIALPDKDLQMSLLRSCHRNLARGGRIYTDFFQPRYDVICCGSLREPHRFRTPSGDLYHMIIEYTNDRYSQIQMWDVTYTQIEDGRWTDPTKVHVKFRYLFYSEICLMLEATGFSVVDIDVDYADGRGFAVIAEKV